MNLSNLQFSDLDLAPGLKQGIETAGFTCCTPIQAQTLPLALAGIDVAGQAQTGTGKTAAFLLAAMNRLLHSKPAPDGASPRALILAPTRELADQIYQDAVILAKFTELRIGVVYGGTGYDTQRRMVVGGVDILIGTPGRLIDYFRQDLFHLNALQVAVLDEADRMFDLGFLRDIRYLLRRMPKPEKRLSMLFSATLSHRVLELAYEHMNNPQVIKIERQNVTADNVIEKVYYTAISDKIPLLIGLLTQMESPRAIVFVNTKRAADTVHGYLLANGFSVEVISGDVPQKKRLDLLAKFRDGDFSVLVATDVAARGLHIPEVSHVINFDLPQEAEDYVHRIGRTARAGASGDAISFACEEYSFSLPEIEAYIGHKIPKEPVNELLMAITVKSPKARAPRTDMARPRHKPSRQRR